MYYNIILYYGINIFHCRLRARWLLRVTIRGVMSDLFFFFVHRVPGIENAFSAKYNVIPDEYCRVFLAYVYIV